MIQTIGPQTTNYFAQIYRLGGNVSNKLHVFKVFLGPGRLCDIYLNIYIYIRKHTSINLVILSTLKGILVFGSLN